IAYWVSDRVKEIFEKSEKLGEVGEGKQGLATADNDRFLRMWSEVDIKKSKMDCQNKDEALESGKKWFPYNKGGEKRKWYGNQEYLVNWENDGNEIRNFFDAKGKLRSRPQNTEFYFRESISWGLITSAGSSFRYFPKGFIYDVGGMSYFTNKNVFNTLGILNTKIYNDLTKIINPTINLQIGDVVSLPATEISNLKFNETVQNNIEISKAEWNSRETSWDFETNPLLEGTSIQSAYETYCKTWRENFYQMHSNEEELNKMFIEIYGLEDEMDEKVELKDITLLKKESKILDGELVFNPEELTKQFLSYAIGCVMGRYSLDKKGLIIANSDDELVLEENSFSILGLDGELRHKIENPKFIPEPFGIVPVVKENIFSNDIVEKIVQFVSTVYGEASLEENLEFIASSLGMKMIETPRDTIRKYFLKDFYKDHLQRYKKRPIYWMMNSGKKDAFSALIYLHRYEDNTIGRVRADYLVKYQETLDRYKDYYDRLLTDSDTVLKDIKEAEKKLKE
ncbi:MAG: BREX-1 system adenine-specific DNA-methyltransferase PglX, partial [Fusobacteriaceae bacterium]